MTTSNRKTRGYKEKSSMLAFGQIALPLAAIVALGLLFVGVKLFFLSPADKGAVEIIPETATVVERPEASGSIFSTEPEPQTTSRQETAARSEISSTPILAGPVGSTSAGTSSKPQSSSAKQQTVAKTQTAAKSQSSTAQKPTQTPTAKPVQRPTQATTSAPQTPAPRSGGFGVQIGAFTRREGADKVAGEAAKLGYKVSIVPTQSASGTFYRVRVQAGATRDEAARTAAELEKKGYPVAIVAN